MMTGIEHVGLSVSDLDRSVAFYRDILGLELARLIECPPEMRLGDVVGLPPCRVRIAHMQSAKAMLELFEYQDPRGRPIPKDRSQADNGYTHIGFTCTDVRGDYERLTRLGIRFIHEPVEFRPQVWIAYFHGPDGEVCELRET